MTMPGLFEAQVARAPDAVAAVYGDVSVTYEELNKRANRMARLLVAQGVGPESAVAVVMDRSAELIVALLGVVKAGAAYLTVDPGYPAERISFVLRNAHPAVIVASESAAEDLPALVFASVLVVGEPGLAAELESAAGGDLCDEERLAPLVAAHPAYVIYTSGSTGTPKGVVVAHGGVVSLARAQIERFAVGPGCRMLQFASPTFDASVSELVTALGSGAALVVAGGGELLPGPGLVGLAARQGVTHLTVPPAVLAVLEPGSLATVRVLVSAGEALGRELVARWASGRRFINAYGPTEVTVCATMTGPLPPEGSPHIGAPIAGTRVFVLDEWLRPVPAGVAGELYVAGAG